MIYDTYDVSYILTINSYFAVAFHDQFMSLVLYSMAIQLFVIYRKKRGNKNATIPQRSKTETLDKSLLCNNIDYTQTIILLQRCSYEIDTCHHCHNRTYFLQGLFFYFVKTVGLELELHFNSREELESYQITPFINRRYSDLQFIQLNTDSVLCYLC